jgi:hypothetical protein
MNDGKDLHGIEGSKGDSEDFQVIVAAMEEVEIQGILERALVCL